ncbi:acetyl-CoA carboxylase, biotin carboxyl carrier protein [Listeria monocytogenes]|uniref:acetyl-CoA carboxylase biotin carboxyl carrier protein n=1 Tax=Listeria monocytogenes TaxID=1639 RepID=UPI0010D73532|nr:acetyl-CoA carboxylase biotin carboxyl carrier protein subunit [Listeria monocytogenes]EAD7632586.1 acetyl-CoA carboxylase, biotin carboxyl carrier protein [Listeria monocytogenes]
MDYPGIQQTIEQFDRSSLAEFELNEDGRMLHMTKTSTNKRNKSEIERSLKKSVIEEIKEPLAGASSEKMICAPLVGITYLQPTPDAAAFKKAGDPVKKGEVVCIIEAMKLMNEIVSDQDGIIDKVLVENEAVVEFNQPLFRISPELSK